MYCRVYTVESSISFWFGKECEHKHCLFPPSFFASTNSAFVRVEVFEIVKIHAIAQNIEYITGNTTKEF